MTYTYPYAFLLFLPLVFAAWRMLRRSRARGVKFAVVSRIPVKTVTWRVVVANIAPYLLLIGLSLLIVAASRPRTIDEERTNNFVKVDAIAISMVVDVSGSMMEDDMSEGAERITRMDVVKKRFADFIKKRPHDLISLVTFGTFAVKRTPLTLDHKTVLDVLKDVEVPFEDGEAFTAIGDGLSVALLQLKDAQPKSKVVVLLSDGVSNRDVVMPEQAAAAAKKMGVKVYTIGVGTKPDYADGGYFNEEQLKSIAEETSGMYFAANDKKGLAKALEKINKLEKTAIEVEKWNCWNEHFPVFLLGGILFVVLGGALSVLAVRRLA